MAMLSSAKDGKTGLTSVIVTDAVLLHPALFVTVTIYCPGVLTEKPLTLPGLMAPFGTIHE